MADKSEGEKQARIRNLQGLLRWSASLETDGAVAPNDMDPEKREYLERLMETMTASKVDEMAGIFGVMQLQDGDPGAGTTEELTQVKLEALEALQDIIEDIDNASDFVKIGGVGVCYAALHHAAVPIRLQAIGCLAAAAQNNPLVQHHLFETGALDKFTAILTAPDPECSPALLERAVRGLSCLVRGEPKIIEAFVRKGGDTMLADLLGTSQAAATVDGLRTKVAYLAASLAQDFPVFKNVAQPTGLLAALVATLGKTASDPVWEQTLRALVNITQGKTDGAAYLAAHTELLHQLAAREAVTALRSDSDKAALMEETAYTATLRDRSVGAVADPSVAVDEAAQAAQAPLAIAGPGQAPEALFASSATSAPAGGGGSGGSAPAVFVPTAEWQVIGAEQMVPGGIEVNIDMQTGVKRGRTPPE